MDKVLEKIEKCFKIWKNYSFQNRVVFLYNEGEYKKTKQYLFKNRTLE